MRAVLGIDAAWTARNASGVAVAVERGSAWGLVAVAKSYEHLYSLADPDRPQSPPGAGSLPDPVMLLRSAERLAGCRIDLVAVDMPLARSPIIGRRASDNAVSSAYGARGCGTHSPSAVRPGAISDRLREGFEAAGYPLSTTSLVTPGLIEVYPHPALVELAGSARRLPYKLQRSATYWRERTPVERRMLLRAQWANIVAMLEPRLEGVAAALPPPVDDAPLAVLKSYEDMLDAIVCAWVAVSALSGEAVPYGDQESAIWVPSHSQAVRA